jgi:hypothetical protein
VIGNKANEWVKQRIPQLKREFGGKCEHKGCGERRLTMLEFAHTRKTSLSGTGPRGRKEKAADIAAHPGSYKLMCHKHHRQDFKGKRGH